MANTDGSGFPIPQPPSGGGGLVLSWAPITDGGLGNVTINNAEYAVSNGLLFLRGRVTTTAAIDPAGSSREFAQIPAGGRPTVLRSTVTFRIKPAGGGAVPLAIQISNATGYLSVAFSTEASIAIGTIIYLDGTVVTL